MTTGVARAGDISQHPLLVGTILLTSVLGFSGAAVVVYGLFGLVPTVALLPLVVLVAVSEGAYLRYQELERASGDAGVDVELTDYLGRVGMVVTNEGEAATFRILIAEIGSEATNPRHFHASWDKEIEYLDARANVLRDSVYLTNGDRASTILLNLAPRWGYYATGEPDRHLDGDYELTGKRFADCRAYSPEFISPSGKPRGWAEVVVDEGDSFEVRGRVLRDPGRSTPFRAVLRCVSVPNLSADPPDRPVIEIVTWEAPAT